MKRTTYVADPERAGVVRRIFSLAAEGQGDKTIAALLNAEGVAPPSTRARAWDAMSLRAIRLNATYKGVLVHGRSRFVRTERGTRVPIENPREAWLVSRSPYVEALVDETTWESAQRAERRRPEGSEGGASSRRGGPNPRYALSGVVRCGDCGGPMQGAALQARGHRYIRLRCGHRLRRGNSVCRNRRLFPYDAVFEAVLDVLDRDLFTEENVRQLVSLVRREVESRGKKAGEHGRALASALAETEDRIQRVLGAIESSDGGQSSSLVGRLRELEAEKRERGAKLRESSAGAVALTPGRIENRVRARLARIPEVLARANPVEVQAELRRHFKEIRLSTDGRLRIEGTLGGLLPADAAVVCNYYSGGGI